MGVLVIKALLFGVCTRAPDFWKLPSSELSLLSMRLHVAMWHIHRPEGDAMAFLFVMSCHVQIFVYTHFTYTCMQSCKRIYRRCHTHIHACLCTSATYTC